MAITKRQRLLMLITALVTYSIGTTFACIAWMQQDVKYKALILQKDTSILLLEGNVELLKNSIRVMPSIEVEEPILSVNATSKIDEAVTTNEQVIKFINKNLPNLMDQSESFLSLANDYGIDTGFALATFILETGWGKSELWVRSNNPAGLTCSYGYCRYSSKAKGLESMFRRLNEYVNGSVSWIGIRRTADEVRQKWSTTQDTEVIVEIWNQILTY